MNDRVTVLIVHNRYLQPGGEDRVVDLEANLLGAAGHTVLRYEVHNSETSAMTRGELATRMLWNRRTYVEVTNILRDSRADVVHVHNTLPLISPSVFVAARRSGAAVVQTLHNYRLVCPSATLFRAGTTCELCVAKPLAWSAIRHACYRSNRAATAAIALTASVHRVARTNSRHVDRFIALTDFARQVFLREGIRPDRLVVKPNFSERQEQVRPRPGAAALFVGRLSEEKGLTVLLRAWEGNSELPPLRIAGDGPMRPVVEAAAAASDRITVLGAIPRREVQEEMRQAAMLVFPSIWYEGFPMTIVEAFSMGLPVVASRIGSVAEIVTHGDVGLNFVPGDPDDLAAAVRRLASDPALNVALGKRALERHESLYTPTANLELLMRIYSDAMRDRPRRSAV